MPNQHRNTVHPRDEIVRTIDRIYHYGMTTTSGGNLSIRESNGNIWITPARVDKGNLTRDDIVCVRRDGTIDGRHPPSSEFPFHRDIYNVRSDVHGIVHAHPSALVAFSICGEVPNTRLVHQSFSVCGRIGFAPYACPGSDELAKNIATTFSDGCQSVILENHGVVVAGDDLGEAFQRFEAFEFAGKTLIQAKRLGGVRFLDDQRLRMAAERGVDFETFDFPKPTPLECELRSQLCQFVRRGCRQRLLISTEGSYSARLDENSFLISPTGRDRERLERSDYVLVEGDLRERGKRASRAARAHQSIYRAHPDVNSIVFAHPVHATAFSVTDQPLDVRTIPESYVFLSDVSKAPYGSAFGDPCEIAQCVSSRHPAALIENDGVVVTGTSVLDAFDRLEVLESTAEALINAKSIGELSVMGESVIEELRERFSLA
ncbi:MAG: class II aldolase/adducin family protein [Planctomycetota bacterium]